MSNPSHWRSATVRKAAIPAHLHGVGIDVCRRVIWVFTPLASPFALLHSYIPFRFIVATFTLERLTNYFGRFPLSSEHRLFFPPLHLSILSCFRYISTCMTGPEGHRWLGPKAMGFSLAQGRHFLLILAAFLQTCFFITISTSPTFAGVVAGFFMNGLAKAYMMCELSPGTYSWLQSKMYWPFLTNQPPWTRIWFLIHRLSDWVTCIHSTALALSQRHFYVKQVWNPSFCFSLYSWLLNRSGIAKKEPWQRFYLYSIALAFVNILSVTLTFRPAREEFLRDRESSRGVETVEELHPNEEDKGTIVSRDLEKGHVVNSRLSSKPTETNGREESQVHDHNLPRNSKFGRSSIRLQELKYGYQRSWTQ
jgi:hypothetical protein